MKTLFSLALSLTILATATLSAASDGGPRIRPQDNRIKQVLQEGAARSATFKALVDRIEASDVIVYVAINPLLKSSLAGSLTWMTEAGGYRYLRASISPEMLFDQMIAKVQSLRLTSGPLQRRLGLCSLHVDTAGRRLTGAVAVHRGAAEGQALLDDLAARARAARTRASAAERAATRPAGP